jgi:hypothetical protein
MRSRTGFSERQRRFRSVADISTEHLSTYLNDHLAGSVGALELIEHLTKKHPNSTLQAFFADLHREVSADQDVLRDLLKTFEGKESSIKKAGAWVMEKVGEAKFEIGGDDAGGVGLLQALEGLVLGITGKELLWRTLASAAETWPELRGLDYAELERRAVAQRDMVEQKRIEAAAEAFAPEKSV